MINRRQFLRAGAAATAALAWPFRAFPFSLSLTPIHKFTVALPGLGPNGANELGNYIPVLQPDTMTMPGTDVYKIVATQFEQQLHPDIPTKTKLWGYADATTPDLKYLGGVIEAMKGRPVRLEVFNQLPAKHILPVDETLVDPMIVPTGGRTDIIAVHLHGGLVFWDSDGGPFSWFSNPDNGGFVKGPSFLETSLTNTNPQRVIYNYPNGQSARTIWYHDHAYSLTRTNVFAGLASAFLIIDGDEQQLVADGVLPGQTPAVTLVGPTGLQASYPFGIPLIIQDKTFWDPSKGDSGYPNAVPSGPALVVPGDLWYPHEYEGALDADLPSMTLTDLPAEPPNTKRWGANPVGAAPTVSTVPEYFSDTSLVNGAPYPTVKVPPQRLRFRILNAANARFYNLQLYVADGTLDGITLVDTGDLDANSNPILAPRNRPGPAIIQVANEAGFLEHPVLFSADGTNRNSNRVIGFKNGSDPGALRHRRADAGIVQTVAGDRIRLNVTVDPTSGNADRYNLLLAPAERADVIIDFRDFAGQNLILYNDAPAPFPGGDIRNDYYVSPAGMPHDLTSIGGAPPTQAGMGPDTRVLMRFEVASNGIIPGEMTFDATLAALESRLPAVFVRREDPQLPLLPEPTHKGKSLLEDNEEGTSMPLPFGRLRQLIGDGTGEASTLLDPPTDFATVGEIQYWDIFNLTADTHPMHFHLVNVNVVKRAQWAFDADGAPVMNPDNTIQVIPGTDRLPDPNEMGWKETVRMNPGEVTTVAMKFDLPSSGTQPQPSPRFANDPMFAGAAEYVWHCHILEHEEHDMMHPLLVLPQGFVAARRQ